MIISTLVLLLSLAGLGIKTLVLRNGEFKRHCASMDPYSGNRSGCHCAAQHSGICHDRARHPYQPLDVNKNLMDELIPEDKTN
jgi:hypothetical protein